MNLFVELKAFRNFLETNPLKPNAQVLWFHLMMIANESGWKKELSIPNSVLMARTGIASKNTLISNRNILIQAKRISYKSRGRTRAGIYVITPFDETSSPKGEPVSSPSSSPKTSPYLDIDSDVDKDKTSSLGSSRDGLNQFKSTRTYVSHWPTPNKDMTSQLKLYRQEVGDDLLTHSLEYLAKNNVSPAGVPKYLEKVINCWVKNDITTVSDALNYEKNRTTVPSGDGDVPDIPIFKLTD
ncbi:DnaD domain protein [Levilactobacillus brevis]|uniref:DnaD domain protein n=1 Tax=Levilactobacillus brevis TaxID=1580 RepID=UPI001F2CD129|nr:DnaD domain protein [Levilactobacillus brevis]MCE6012990.1 DnaD domain protein [Levilactobacillus brevis]MCE6015394.1 DnaD domain protein [Levilactobacillus brevis]MCE6017805.1 DnaD domain protein [Levilactobacillus brevis]MCE6020228.1 DnaD domain protein [Levilactobacillus brevis]MCE6022768.1 DnaD domain protein [Levilactobacillus brevis]